MAAYPTVSLLLCLLVVSRAHAAMQDMQVQAQEGLYNPSLVMYQGAAVFVARTTELKWDTTGKKWILNRAFLCTTDPATFNSTSCAPWDPWRGRHRACRAGAPRRPASWDAHGVDDTHLFTWPRRGLWAVTGRRPRPPPGSPHCAQPLVWQQFLVQLAPQGAPLNISAWQLPWRPPRGVTWAPSPPSPSPALSALVAGPSPAAGGGAEEDSMGAAGAGAGDGEEDPYAQDDTPPQDAAASPTPSSNLAGLQAAARADTDDDVVQATADEDDPYAADPPASPSATAAAAAAAIPQQQQRLRGRLLRQQGQPDAAPGQQQQQPPPRVGGSGPDADQVFKEELASLRKRRRRRKARRRRQGAGSAFQAVLGAGPGGAGPSGGVVDDEEGFVEAEEDHLLSLGLGHTEADGQHLAAAGAAPASATVPAAAVGASDPTQGSTEQLLRLRQKQRRGRRRRRARQRATRDTGGGSAAGGVGAGSGGGGSTTTVQGMAGAAAAAGGGHGGVSRPEENTTAPALQPLLPPQQQQQQQQQQQAVLGPATISGPSGVAAAAPQALVPQATAPATTSTSSSQSPAARGVATSATGVPEVVPAGSPADTAAATQASFTHLLPRQPPTTWAAYAGAPPVGLLLSDAASAYTGRRDVMEKNWMPLVWRGRLYVVTSLVPHRVARVWPNGTVVTRYETDSGPTFSAALGAEAASRLHGGPPMLLLNASRPTPAAATQRHLQQQQQQQQQQQGTGAVQGDGAVGGGPTYLGVGHYWVPRPVAGGPAGRRYIHFLYKASAAPPFGVTQVSRELPLADHPHWRGVAFAAGLAWDGTRGRVLVSYGAGDWVSRVVALTRDDLDQLFTPGSNQQQQQQGVGAAAAAMGAPSGITPTAAAAAGGGAAAQSVGATNLAPSSAATPSAHTSPAGVAAAAAAGGGPGGQA